MQLSDLTFERVLGKGGFGEASLYTNTKGKQIVIKSISKKKNCQKLVRREILAGQSLSHKNIAKFHAHFEDDNNNYLAFDYVKGISTL